MANTQRITITKFLFLTTLLLVLTLIVALFALSIGSVNISVKDIITSFFNSKNSTVHQIIFDIRLPRILFAFAIGGGLSVAGAVFQAMLLNPLAEPYILGISSGGSFGAVLSFLLGISFWGTQLFAFAGALIVILLVFSLGRRFGEIEPDVLLLSGVMIGAFFAAGILLMTTMLDNSLRMAVLWLIGSLSFASNQTLIYVLPITFITVILLTLNAQKYNVISLGSESAKQLGINTKLVMNETYILTSIMVGSIVSVSGIIGFVGLIIPHISRMILGQDYRLIIPSSFFIGAMFLIIADTIARTIISPSEIPVGAVTALIGAPVFIYLLRKRFNIYK